METIFSESQLLELDPIPSAYDDKIAWQMAELSRIAYLKFEEDEETILREKLESGKYELIKTFKGFGVQAIFVRCVNTDLYALVFRGTELKFDDIATDISLLRRKTEAGLMHAGFKRAYDVVKDEIDGVLETIDSRNIYVAGHSLGGALAVVAASSIRKKNKLAACYTFGCPKIGEAEVDWKVSTAVYRIINEQDLVPQLPIILGAFYRHVGDLRFLTRDGRMLRSPGYNFKNFRFLFNFYRRRGWGEHKIKLYGERLAWVALRRIQGK